MNLLPEHQSADVFLRRDALAAGYDDRAIRELVRSGDWWRVRRGAYVAGQTWADADARQRHHLVSRAVLLQAKSRCVLSHVSALPAYDAPVWGLPLDFVHVTRPDGRGGRAEAGVRQHCGRLPEEDVVSWEGVEVTSATKTALDVTTMGSTEPALCVVNHLLHHGHTTPQDLERRYASMQQDPHTLATDLVLRLADARIESVGETRTFFLCWNHGLPAPEPQWKVRDENGVIIARLDFAWPELGVWLEFDGREKYVKYLAEDERVTDVVLREKRREDRVRELTGWRCVRITWADLESPQRTAARIRAMLVPQAA